MSEILQANVFFIITSVAVLILTILVCIILYYVIKIVRSISRIVDRIEAGSDAIIEDVSSLRTYVANGSLVSQIISFFFGSKISAKRNKKKATTL